MKKRSNWDLSLLSALLSGLFALVEFFFEGGYWVSGVFYAAFALFFILDYSDKKEYLKKIGELKKENEELKKNLKNK